MPPQQCKRRAQWISGGIQSSIQRDRSFSNISHCVFRVRAHLAMVSKSLVFFISFMLKAL